MFDWIQFFYYLLVSACCFWLGYALGKYWQEDEQPATKADPKTVHRHQNNHLDILGLQQQETNQQVTSNQKQATRNKQPCN